MYTDTAAVINIHLSKYAVPPDNVMFRCKSKANVKQEIMCFLQEEATLYLQRLLHRSYGEIWTEIDYQ